MNGPIAVLLVFALLGAVDRVLENRFGLGQELERGLASMGNLMLSMGGLYCFAVMLGKAISSAVGGGAAVIFDPSLLVSALLGPDMGAYAVATQLSSNKETVCFVGIMVASTLGATLSFSIPIALGSVGTENTGRLMNGMIYGIITIPAALLVYGLVSQMPFLLFLEGFLPIAAACALVCAAMLFIKSLTTRIFLLLGKIIRCGSILLFALVVWQIFVGGELVSPELIPEILLIVFKISVIISGSFVLSSLVLRLFSSQLAKIASKLKINEFAVVGLILSLATSVSMFALFHKMDRRGQIVNAAFSVSAAFVLGGQLAFVSTVESQIVPAYILSKLVGGIAAFLVAYVASKREIKE